MAFSIRLTDEEKALAESYAKLHSVSLGEAFKRALFECIEDEYDLTAAAEAYKDYIDSGCKATPAADFWRESWMQKYKVLLSLSGTAERSMRTKIFWNERSAL